MRRPRMSSKTRGPSPPRSLLHEPVVVAHAGQKEPTRTELGEHVLDRQTQVVILEQVRQRVIAGEHDVELTLDL